MVPYIIGTWKGPKMLPLTLHKGNFNKKMYISPGALADVLWWKHNVMWPVSPIHRSLVHTTLYSHASLEGWGGGGGGEGVTNEVLHVGGRWTETELPHHNSNYINKQNGGGGGDHSKVCNITKHIWNWDTHRNIWLSAAYVPGSNSQIADSKSRHFNENTEWSLSTNLFAKILQQFYNASRLNCQVATFVSWKPEPEAWGD